MWHTRGRFLGPEVGLSLYAMEVTDSVSVEGSTHSAHLSLSCQLLASSQVLCNLHCRMLE